MTTNVHPEYIAAEKKFYLAKTPEEKLIAMEEMLSTMPQHKSAESMRANLRTRYKKLKESIEKQKKSKSGGKTGIKKYDIQCIIIGFPNSGKSSLFQSLTGKQVSISDNPFSTTCPDIGMSSYENTQFQVIDMPPFPNIDKSIINTADTIILAVDNIEQIEKAKEFLTNQKAKLIIVFTKSDLLNEIEKRKLEERLKSKKYNFILFSSKTKENLNELKKKIFETFPIIRIYTKEPNKPISTIPMLLKPSSTLEEVAEKILKGFSKKIKRAKIWGPSSKFSGQIVGLDHILKDKDTVEFQTR
jgi:small GTP-binding protein